MEGSGSVSFSTFKNAVFALRYSASIAIAKADKVSINMMICIVGAVTPPIVIKYARNMRNYIAYLPSWRIP